MTEVISNETKPQVLMVDIGGTNVRFGVYTDGQEENKYDISYEVAQFKTFVEAIEQYLKDKNLYGKPNNKIRGIVIGAAGGISPDKRRVTASNTPWKADLDEVQKAFPQIKYTALDNDFVIQGHAIRQLAEYQYNSFMGSKKITDLSSHKVLVVGPGTGLGHCIVEGHHVTASEAGHMTLPDMVDIQDKQIAQDYQIVRAFLKEKKPKGVVAEHILSGTGIRNVYQALKEHETGQEQEFISAREVESLAQAGDPIALRSFNVFSACLGAHVGNVASHTLCDTVFFNGGFLSAPWIQNYLQQNREEFDYQLTHRAGMTEPMKNLTFAVTNYRNMGELGSIAQAQDLISEYKGDKEHRREVMLTLRLLESVHKILEKQLPDLGLTYEDLVQQTTHRSLDDLKKEVEPKTPQKPETSPRPTNPRSTRFSFIGSKDDTYNSL